MQILTSNGLARQFVEAGGLAPPIIALVTRPQNPNSVVVDVLLAVSQLARLSKDYYEPIAKAGLYDALRRSVHSSYKHVAR